MTRHRTAFVLAPTLLCAALASASTARGYEEQASLDVSAGYVAKTAADTVAAHGPALDVGAELGVSDLFVVRGALGYAPRLGDDLEQAGRLRVEGAYLVDVVRWVPFFGLGASLWVYEHGSRFEARPAGHALIGVDFLASRTLVVGLDVRTGALWEGRTAASITEANIRISRMFEMF